MRESIKMKTEDYNFKFRVSGVIIKNDKLLLVNMDDSGFLCLPGGYVELGETTEEAMRRELLEEIGKKFEIDKYLGVVENYFINKYAKKIHEISFYYLMTPVEKMDTNNFTIIENDKGHKIKLDIKWIALKEIKNYDIRPSILKQILESKNLEFNHLILNELDKIGC
ncbi:MAG TPA: NUDIX domain-containing protein [Candidatus Faecimonas gallistercoris]|nr:NUDIX domain-containing protein [Candidatus Faecimonas gallistercoris]